MTTFQSALSEIIDRHRNQAARIEIIYLANELQRRQQNSPGGLPSREAGTVTPAVSNLRGDHDQA